MTIAQDHEANVKSRTEEFAAIPISYSSSIDTLCSNMCVYIYIYMYVYKDVYIKTELET